MQKPEWRDRLFSGADNFFTRRSLTKYFQEIFPANMWLAYKKVLRKTAQDAEKAYRMGVEEGLAGNTKPTAEGLREILSGTEHPEEMEAICLFIHDAACAGYEVGKAKRELFKGAV